MGCCGGNEVEDIKPDKPGKGAEGGDDGVFKGEIKMGDYYLPV